MSPRRIRALGYARVSSEEQARGSSLSDQQNSIRAYAKACGLTVANLYVEAESGIREKAELRVELQRLLASVRAGDVVVCDKLDRWSRDTEFTLRSVREILEKGASFFAISDQCDPSTRDGDMMMTMRAMFAKEEHKRIKERMVGTRRLMRDRGLFTEGHPPLGYRRTLSKGYKGAEKNVLVIVPDEAETVRQVFKMCVGGQSLVAIANDVGLSESRVRDVLHRRGYLGEIQNTQGEWLRATHEPIVDPDLFTRAQACLSGRRTGRRRNTREGSETSTWILRDVAVCGHCNGKMSSAFAGGAKGQGNRRHYYRCYKRCVSDYIRVAEVEALMGPLVLVRLAELREQLARGEAAPLPRAETDNTERRTKLDKKRARLLESHADGIMTLPELRTAIGKLDAERLRLDAKERTEATPSPLNSVTVRREVLAQVKELGKAWKHALEEGRRAIVNILASSVRIAAGEPPAPVWVPAEVLAGNIPEGKEK